MALLSFPQGISTVADSDAEYTPIHLSRTSEGGAELVSFPRALTAWEAFSAFVLTLPPVANPVMW